MDETDAVGGEVGWEMSADETFQCCCRGRCWGGDGEVEVGERGGEADGELEEWRWKLVHGGVYWNSCNNESCE